MLGSTFLKKREKKKEIITGFLAAEGIAVETLWLHFAMRDTFDVCGVSKWRGLYHVSFFARKYTDLRALLSCCTAALQPSMRGRVPHLLPTSGESHHSSLV